MFSLLAASSASATALGVYNISRFVIEHGIKKRRAMKEARALKANVDAAVRYAKGVYDAIADGVSEEEAAEARAVLAQVKSLLAEKEAKSNVAAK